MKRVNGIVAAVAVAGLLAAAACSPGYSPPEMMNRAEPVGSPFTKYLAEQYNTLAHSLAGADEVYFAKKGLAAVDGMIVMPETLQDRDINGPEVADMAESRGELITLLQDGGRDRAPDLAAIAQTRFDCWVALRGGTLLDREPPHYPGEEVSCKDQFIAVVNSLRQALAVAPPSAVMSQPPQPPAEEFPEPVVTAPRGAETPLSELSFLVFFDWNKYNVSPSADDVLETVVHEIKSHEDVRKINISGYTDTSGKEKYNLKLSLQRANAVRALLIAHGIPAKKIHTIAHGKSDLLIKTPDGVREPQNRRAQITFE